MAKHKDTVVLPSSGAALVTSIELPDGERRGEP